MKKKVLIVEDRPDTREMLKVALENDGYDILEAEDGEMGLLILEKRDVDAVILDILLPKIDGKEVLKSIRADKKYKDLRILMLTASKATQSTINEYLKLGANGFLLKPIEIKKLRTELRNALKTK